MKIAHGLFTWQEPQLALEASLRSTVGVVDEVIIADGLIDGVPDLGLPHVSDLGWMVDADYLPARVPISSHGPTDGYYPWASLSQACNFILTTAKRLNVDWLLFVDGDQELHNGDQLRHWLETWPGDTLPITRQERNGRILVPWQCIRVSAFTRYVSGCYVLQHADGRTVNLVPLDAQIQAKFLPSAPWISHHPERRGPVRYAHRLGQLETILEPPPQADPLQGPTDLLFVPVMSEAQIADLAEADAPPVASSPDVWYCGACGTRYNAPGVCTNQHEPTELRLVADDEPNGGAESPSREPVDTTAPPAVRVPAPTAGGLDSEDTTVSAESVHQHLAEVDERIGELIQLVRNVAAKLGLD